MYIYIYIIYLEPAKSGTPLKKPAKSETHIQSGSSLTRIPVPVPVPVDAHSRV